jgi:hypothetical protein
MRLIHQAIFQETFKFIELIFFATATRSICGPMERLSLEVAVKTENS